MSVENNKEGPLPPLAEIWLCPFIENKVLVDGKRVWRCLHPGCIKEGDNFNGKNSTKSLGSVLGIKGYSIIACTGNISRANMDQYWQLHECKLFSKLDQKGKRKQLAAGIDDIQTEVAASRMGTKPIYTNPNNVSTPPCRKNPVINATNFMVNTSAFDLTISHSPNKLTIPATISSADFLCCMCIHCK